MNMYSAEHFAFESSVNYFSEICFHKDLRYVLAKFKDI